MMSADLRAAAEALTTPTTAVEEGELLSAVNVVPAMGLILRRILWQRDALRARLAEPNPAENPAISAGLPSAPAPAPSEDAPDWEHRPVPSVTELSKALASAASAPAPAPSEATTDNVALLTHLCERLYLCGTPEAMARHLDGNGVRHVLAAPVVTDEEVARAAIAYVKAWDAVGTNLENGCRCHEDMDVLHNVVDITHDALIDAVRAAEARARKERK